MKTPGFYLEIGQSSLQALDGEDGLELSLERLENGRLSPLCRERLILSLRVFLKKHSWRPRLHALCALGARGVSLRRVTLPGSSKEELRRLLPLQIEREFPLAPEELAWGYRLVRPSHPAGNGAPAVQELVVAAVKKEVVEEYAEILAGCGLTPAFTLAALARGALCVHPPQSYALLDIGRHHSELICFEQGVPNSIRVLAWGGEDLTSAIAKALGMTQPEAERVKQGLNEKPGSDGDLGQTLQAVLAAEVRCLAQTLQPKTLGRKLYLTGGGSRLKDFGSRLGKALGGSVECERLELKPGEGRSAAVLGLKRACELPQPEEGPPLLLQVQRVNGAESAARSAPWKWAALAGALLLAALGLRYAEFIIQKPRVARRVAELKAYRDKLPKLDQTLSFLQYLQTNQPPYLDPLHAIATAAPSGTRIESLSLNRRGDLALRAALASSQQVVDFRAKLLESGLFSSVVVEDQAPAPDHQKVLVRISGQWKPFGARKPSAPTAASKLPPAAESGNTNAARLPITHDRPH